MKKSTSKLLKPDWRKILVFIALLLFVFAPIIGLMSAFADQPVPKFIEYISAPLILGRIILGFPLVLVIGLAFMCNIWLGVFSALVILTFLYYLSCLIVSFFSKKTSSS
ncbi:MAG: hypothetical protein PHG13_00965 [Candidatus Pacebacteria bacterium]|nr:hypothetical protein [Candidatus Paceibacterota bacterium]MDD5721963.1 hypothetical protein [Candidatus Paceibacterota bacterium]